MAALAAEGEPERYWTRSAFPRNLHGPSGHPHGDFELLLVFARHIKHVPARRTDLRDCEWVAQLLECGLLRGSFVPPPEIRDLGDLTRLRKSLIGERSRQMSRVAKTLEIANIKLGSVVVS